MSSEHVSVVVIGVGPTGASAAIMLGQRGLKTLVLERWRDVYPLPRACHFDDEVFRTFAQMGLENEVRAISRPAPGMQLTDAKHRVLATFRRDPERRVHGYPQANMFDQPDLERVLREAIGNYEAVELRTGVEVFDIAQIEGGPAPVRVRYRETESGAEHEVWTDAVLGCDGANSITRAVVGAVMEDFDFEQQWLVVDVETQQPLDVYDGIQQVCDFRRPATFMPVTPGRYRWEFRLQPGEAPEDFTNEMVLKLIQPWLSGVDLEQVTFLRQTCYMFRGVVADKWQDRRVFLLGDAAHQTPPFIGQGMCAGIRDAANLVWKLALVLNSKADDRILATYESERRPHVRRVVQLAILIGWIMTGGSTITGPLRRAALRTLTRLPGAEDKVFNSVWPAFGESPLVGDTKGSGELFGQPLVDGTRLDDLAGPDFAVVYRGADRIGAFDPATRAFFDDLGVVPVRIGADDIAAAEFLDRHRANAVLLRPDRIVAAAADTPDLRTWQRVLRAAGITSQDGS